MTIHPSTAVAAAVLARNEAEELRDDAALALAFQVQVWAEEPRADFWAQAQETIAKFNAAQAALEAAREEVSRQRQLRDAAKAAQ